VTKAPPRVPLAPDVSAVDGTGQDARAVITELRPWLLKFAERFAYSRGDAEDLVQETLVDFHARFQNKAIGYQQARVYLTISLKNAFLRQLRSTWVRRRAVEDPVVGESLVPATEPESPEFLFSRVENEELERALETLSPKLRQVLELRSKGMSYAEISSQLGLTPGAVGKRLFDARQQLRKQLLEVATKRMRAF